MAPLRPRIRPARTAALESRLGDVLELLRAAPHRAVPILQQERVVALVTERSLLKAFLAAATPDAQRRLKQRPVASVLDDDVVLPSIAPHSSFADAVSRFDALGTDVLVVMEPDTGHYLGLLARGDLVDDLSRPFLPLLVGGLATPIGVYLTTGSVSGGAGIGALALTGFSLFVVQALLLIPVTFAEKGAGAALANLPLAVTLQAAIAAGISSIVYATLFLLALRLSPVAGYHAAEHQVVHALERQEPLLPDVVRAMPRVHPRCGTNFVAAAALIGLGGVLFPWLGSSAYVASGLLALVFWRRVGAWTQRHLTTRPASDAQIESGIHAAQQLLARHGERPFAVAPPLLRLWRMGFIPILGGYGLGVALLLLCGWLVPPLGALLQPHWSEMLQP
jgi:CBS domain-containing protein